MESSRWNVLGGAVQEKICLEEIYMLSSELEKDLVGSGRVGCAGWRFLAFLCLGEKFPRWTYLARNFLVIGIS